MRQTVLLVRRDAPASWRAVPSGRDDLGRVRVVEVRKGREHDLEPCDRAVSRYPELVRPYGTRGEVLSPDRKSGLPPGYRLEKAGPYFRLFGPDGAQAHEKALHGSAMDALIADLFGGG
jgi:hypothetical protein